MVQKAIDKGRLKSEEKPMKVDTDPFHIQANYIKPMQTMMMGALIGMPRVSTLLSEEEVNQALEEFEKEEESVFLPTRETLVGFLLKKQKAEKEVMLCHRCSVVFDKSTKAFEALEIRKSFQKIYEIDVKGKEKQNINMTESSLESL